MLNKSEIELLKKQVEEKYSGNFVYQRTLIPYFQDSDIKKSRGYIFEAGGTNWRITERTVDENKNITWRIIGQGKESLINYPADINSLEFYFEYLINIIKTVDSKVQELDFIGLIWSNSSIAQKSTITGVSGIQLIADMRTGYNKNEGFIRDLKDGTNLAEVFLKTAKNYLKTKLILMVNDSAVLPCITRENYSAGAVVSTGANSTAIIKYEDKYEHVNLESGFAIKFPKEFLNDYEKEYFTDPELPIEYFSAGKYYGIILSCALNNFLKEKIIGVLESRNVQDLINEDFSCLEKYLNSELIKKHKKEIIKTANSVCQRATICSALMLYSSLLCLEQVFPKQVHKVILDSTVARKSEAYSKSLQSEFAKIIAPNIKAELTVLELLKVGNDELAGPSEALGGLVDYWLSK